MTAGEWAAALREVFGEYRAPTGVGAQAANQSVSTELAQVQQRVNELADMIGGRPRMLVGKPGLDGHSNGAEQIAIRARDAGFEVIYQGIRLTPDQIVTAALQEGVHVVGLSILSGSHVPLVQQIMQRMQESGLGEIPVIVGGIIPQSDEAVLKAAGVARIYTPKDFDLNQIMADITGLVRERVTGHSASSV